MAYLKTPKNESENEHKELFKFKTPPWKEVFRYKCLERLKNSRGRLIEKFRGLNKDYIQDIIEKEWENLHDDDSFQTDISKEFDIKNFDDTEVNDFVSVMEDIRKELIEEEKKILKASHAFSEGEILESTLEWLYRDEVICPICKKYSLIQNNSLILCNCGLRIDTQQDGLTLNHLKKELQEGLRDHEKSCLNQPEFSLLTLCNVTNLAITCETCSFMYIVI